MNGRRAHQPGGDIRAILSPEGVAGSSSGVHDSSVLGGHMRNGAGESLTKGLLQQVRRRCEPARPRLQQRRRLGGRNHRYLHLGLHRLLRHRRQEKRQRLPCSCTVSLPSISLNCCLVPPTFILLKILRILRYYDVIIFFTHIKKLPFFFIFFFYLILFLKFKGLKFHPWASCKNLPLPSKKISPTWLPRHNASFAFLNIEFFFFFFFFLKGIGSALDWVRRVHGSLSHHSHYRHQHQPG